MDINIQSVGAVNDGKTLNTTAIQQAIDKCHAAGGGKVIISGGIYMTGTIILKSYVNLHLAADGILLGSPDCADYPDREDVKHVDSDRLVRWRNSCLIFAEESENISITGLGTIDCNGTSFVQLRQGHTKGWKYERIKAPTPPRAVFFTGCRNVRVEDVTMINQPAGWSYWIHDCDYVTFDKCKVIADVQYPNNDGIHVNSSRNVTISNCSITCGDDCIIVRANNVSLKENKVCEKVVVTNCNLTSYSSGIRIGWINDGVIRNCTFSNIVMTDTTVGIGITLPYIEPVNHPSEARNTAPSDIGREATLIENISFSNIIMDRVSSKPIKVRIHDDPFVQVQGIRNIYFHNVHTRGPEMPVIKGREDCRLSRIHFSDCTFDLTDGTEIRDRAFHGGDSYRDTEHRPMLIRYVDDLHFNNTQFNIL